MAQGSPDLHVPDPFLPNFNHRRRTNAGGRRSIEVAQPSLRPPGEAVGHQTPCHWDKWLGAGPDLQPCLHASRPARMPMASQASLAPQASAMPFSRFACLLQVLERLYVEVQRLQRPPRLVRRRLCAASYPAAACPRPRWLPLSRCRATPTAPPPRSWLASLAAKAGWMAQVTRIGRWEVGASPRPRTLSPPHWGGVSCRGQM